MKKLYFGRGNAKLSSYILTFSLPAGRTCPGALLCKSSVIIKDGKRQIKDGPACQFRCFSASNEVLYQNVYDSRAQNLQILKECGRSVGKITQVILDSLPFKMPDWCRLHVSGDFYTIQYFDGWCRVAREHPSTIFYAYTKSLPFWVKRKDVIPDNLVLTASMGGKFDNLIQKHNLRYVRVVYSEKEAKQLKLPLDHDDSHAINPHGNFALLLHGTQPPKSAASEAWTKIKTTIGGYSK